MLLKNRNNTAIGHLACKEEFIGSHAYTNHRLVQKRKNRYKGQGQIITPSKLLSIYTTLQCISIGFQVSTCIHQFIQCMLHEFPTYQRKCKKKSIIWQYRYVLLSTLCFLIINSLIRSESQATKNMPARQNSFSWLMFFRKSIFFLDLFFFHTLKIIHWFLSINFHPLLKNIKLTSLIKIHTNFKTD